MVSSSKKLTWNIHLGWRSSSHVLWCVLYVMKHAPRAWFSWFSEAIFSIGYTPINSNSALYNENSSHGSVELLLYVNDMITTGNDCHSWHSVHLNSFFMHNLTRKLEISLLFSWYWSRTLMRNATRGCKIAWKKEGFKFAATTEAFVQIAQLSSAEKYSTCAVCLGYQKMGQTWPNPLRSHVPWLAQGSTSRSGVPFSKR